MSVSISENTLDTLQKSSNRSELLNNLKNLKNAVIGNTWKKVEVAEDEGVLGFLLNQIDEISHEDLESLDLVNEAAVIIGALANVGSLTIRPLLLAHTPLHLLNLIHSLISLPFPQTQLNRLLPPVVRALRNILISTADLVWGHLWGVGSEKKVVATGLVGNVSPSDEFDQSERKGKEVPGRARLWRIEAGRALSAVFEINNLSTLLSLIQVHSNPSTLLPLYQLFSRLVALPRHREALASWTPSSIAKSHHAGPSSLYLTRDEFPLSSTQDSFIIDHLLDVISSDQTGRRQNPKLLDAAIDLLASLVKGQPNLATTVLSWSSGYEDEPEPAPPSTPLSPFTERAPQKTPEIVTILLELLNTGPTPVRISAASCLTNIVKAEKTRLQRSEAIITQALDVVIRLLQSEALEEQVRLCFILASLLSDDPDMQRTAAEQECPKMVIQILTDIDKNEEKGDIGEDIASRAREAAFLALAGLAFQNDSTRAFISESDALVLSRLAVALSHRSYGVRAAACQLARALSRTVAIVRTTLVDSGVGEGVIEALKREVDENAKRERGEDSDVLGERAYTVEVAATATLCNLIADFSPLKQTLLNGPAFELICGLTSSPYEPVAHNALWTIKNATFKSTDNTKTRVMAVLGWDKLRGLIVSPTPLASRIQALEILQNLLADISTTEIAKTFENAGEENLLDALQVSLRDIAEPDLRKASLYILSNLALGNDKIRQSIVSRVELVEALSEGLNAKNSSVQLAALKALRHLIESNLKTHRPRPAMVDIFSPYSLRSRVKNIADNSISVDVMQAAMMLGEVLDRGRGSANSGSEVREMREEK